MGILDDILSPIKDAINGIEKPVHVVVNLFGEVIHFTEELIKSFWSMISDLEGLFNASGIETLLLTPFKDAALTAVGDVDKLFDLISQASAPTTEGVKDDLMIPIRAVYGTMKSATSDMLSKLGDLVHKIESEGQSVVHRISDDMNRVKAALEALPTEVGILKRKIAEEFKVVAEDIFEHIPDVPDLLEEAGADAFHTVRRVGQTAETDFTNIERSIKQRFKNENLAMDLFFIVVIGLILLALGVIYMVTKSISLIITIVIMVVISFVVYAIVEVVLGVV